MINVMSLAAEIQSPLEIDSDATVHGIAESVERSNGKLTRTVRTHERRIRSTTHDSDPTAEPFASWWLSFLRGAPVDIIDRAHQQIRIADLFSGAGGLSLGVTEGLTGLGMGVRHVMAADVDEAALDVYKSNISPEMTLHRSVTDLVEFQLFHDGASTKFAFPPVVIDESVAGIVGGIDLVVAGPPCQGNSAYNNHSRSTDPRNLLYLSAPAFAVAVDAKALIIENVPGVRAARQNVVEKTVQLLMTNGYEVTSAHIRADRMGWPQSRSRFFLVATKGWRPLQLEAVEEAMRHEPLPISWALREVLESDEQGFMMESATLSSENSRRIDYLHDNQLFDLPNDQRPECHQNGTSYSAVYGRLDWDRPAPTITTGFLTPGRGRYVHPSERRTLLPREAARLQGFPDTYAFSPRDGDGPTKAQITKWIGDAVPMPLGYAAAISAFAAAPDDR